MTITKVLIDQREPPHIQAQSYGVPPKITMLGTGDAWIMTDIKELLIFERKSPVDLLSSIADGRLFNQVAAMREQTEWAYLVITGRCEPSPDGYVIADGRSTRWLWNSLQGVLAEVQERGVTVWHTPSDSEFGATLQVLAKRDRQGIKPVMPRVDTRGVRVEEQILMALPGIGYERAVALLDAFACNPILAFQWLTDVYALGEVSNIGKATKRNVRKALGMTDDMELCIKTKDRDVSLQAIVRVEANDPLAASLVAAL
jgi:ERCC4-type nuclease